MSKRKHREKLRSRMKRRAPPGSPPGTLTADPCAPQPQIQVFAYSAEQYVERPLSSPEEILQYLGKWPVCWVNVDGLGDVELIRRIGEIFKIHALALEDIVNVNQRPKVDEYGDTQFIVAHMASLTDHLDTEQISIVLGPKFIVTFQERPGWDCLESVRERLRSAHSRLRTFGPDHLLYALLDAVVDQLFPVMEAYGERLENLEDSIMSAPRASAYQDIHEIKRELLHLRRVTWPLREALNSLIREPIDLIDSETRLYLRDCYDHAIRVIDMIETLRELCSDVTNLHLASMSNRMNEIMKVLTVISTLFIPLTFIVGVYGMNFSHEASPWNLPELYTYYGYPICLGVMGAISIAQLFFFRHKGWIGPRARSERMMQRSDNGSADSNRDRDETCKLT